jgi:hypothetical protein
VADAERRHTAATNVQTCPFFSPLNLFAVGPTAFGVDKAWASIFADFFAAPGSRAYRAVQPLNQPTFSNHKPSEKKKNERSI